MIEALEMYQDWCIEVIQALGVQMRGQFRFIEGHEPQHGETGAAFLKRVCREEPIRAFADQMPPYDYARITLCDGLTRSVVEVIPRGS